MQSDIAAVKDGRAEAGDLDMFSPAMPGWLGRHFHLACPRVILASRLKFYVFLEFRTNNNAT